MSPSLAAAPQTQSTLPVQTQNVIREAAVVQPVPAQGDQPASAAAPQRVAADEATTQTEINKIETSTDKVMPAPKQINTAPMDTPVSEKQQTTQQSIAARVAAIDEGSYLAQPSSVQPTISVMWIAFGIAVFGAVLIMGLGTGLVLITRRRKL